MDLDFPLVIVYLGFGWFLEFKIKEIEDFLGFEKKKMKRVKEI